MLRNRMQDLLAQEIGSDDLTEEVSGIIKKAIEKNDTNLLDQYFGPSAHKSYLTDAEITQLNQDLKDKKVSKLEGIYKYFNTVYLRLAFYYACKKGNLKIAKYFIENQHLPGDLDVSVAEQQKFLEPKTKIKGPPLKLAVASGNLDLVKFIYENTEAMVETSIGQPIKATPLMKACEANNEAMVEYLLEKGGNPNAERFASWNTTTPLTIAIAAGNSRIVQLLASNGAIVSNEEVNVAISKNLDLTTIKFLLQHSVNRENPYHPYLLSAIRSGNISLLKELASNPLVKSLDEIAAFNETSIEKRILLAAAESGSLEMMKQVIAEKKLDLKKFLNEEYNYFENKPDREPIHKMEESTRTILYYAACNNGRINAIPLLQYLFEQLKPSATVIEKLCSKGLYEIHTIAYLHSLIVSDPEEKKILQSIAFDLDRLSLAELFKIYNTKFIYEGNIYEKLGHRNFLQIIEERITTKVQGVEPREMLKIINNDKEIATGALLYYCANQFDRHSEMLCYLLTELTIYSNLFSTVDIQNCQGDTLAKFAESEHSYHIMQQLLARGADPDVPNQKGETLLNPIIDFSFLREEHLPWIKNYIREDDIAFAVQNSLSYETKRWLGGNEGIKELLTLTKGMIGNLSLTQLIDDCKQGHNSAWKIKALLSNLSEKYVAEMVRLVKHEGLKNKLSQFELDYYFSRLKNFNPKILEAGNTQEKAKEPSNYNKQSSPVLFRTKGQEEAKTENVLPCTNVLGK